MTAGAYAARGATVAVTAAALPYPALDQIVGALPFVSSNTPAQRWLRTMSRKGPAPADRIGRLPRAVTVVTSDSFNTTASATNGTRTLSTFTALGDIMVGAIFHKTTAGISYTFQSANFVDANEAILIDRDDTGGRYSVNYWPVTVPWDDYQWQGSGATTLRVYAEVVFRGLAGAPVDHVLASASNANPTPTLVSTIRGVMIAVLGGQQESNITWTYSSGWTVAAAQTSAPGSDQPSVTIAYKPVVAGESVTSPIAMNTGVATAGQLHSTLFTLHYSGDV